MLCLSETYAKFKQNNAPILLQYLVNNNVRRYSSLILPLLIPITAITLSLFFGRYYLEFINGSFWQGLTAKIILGAVALSFSVPA